MDMTPGRAMYSPDEEWKPLRPPKTVKSLSANASEFVPRQPNDTSAGTSTNNSLPGNSVQERLLRHQKQYIQDNYQQYQQPQQEQPQQHQQYNQPYANGYNNQQQHQLTQQMHNMNVQDRLRRPNNGASGSGGGNNSTFYPSNQSYHRNNKHHHHNNHHNNHNHHHNPQRYNNSHHYSQNHQYHHNNQQQHHNHHQHHHNQQHSNQNAAAGATDPASDVQNIALDYLQTVIQCLNQNPGQFDTIATRFITIFDGMENNHYVLSIAMEDIFNESIKNPNFRYMGARLYNLLHMLNPSKDSLFHTFLKCKLDYHQEEMRNYIQTNQQGKVRETALFLAELYMQLRGDDSRIYLIAENIVYSLKQLLQHVTADNVRCICLTLKLAGYDLSQDCSEDIKEIISSLDTINMENPGKYPLASNVISLQKNNWGRKVSGSDSLADAESSKPPEPLRISDDPVFYGPDGREITAEECEFLTNGANNDAAAAAGGVNGSSDNEDELGELDPEMDEETERDYKLFLKQANNS
ncbi:polyadenylate-binding protein-interacting protein 1-like [Haematobia irritans]|uniref:polyadenylate-binding protein-interacting protein 1-like n=1 Tax=Haematobia irritans TaxID=7368 RepID=UPI003F4FE4B7